MFLALFYYVVVYELRLDIWVFP